MSDSLNLPDKTNIALLEIALTNQRGEDQQRIARTGLAWITTLLKKNKDYGSSAWTPPILAPECDPETAIRVRMSDKINRINQLLKNTNTPEVAESLEDSINDLGAYCLLLLTCPKK